MINPLFIFFGAFLQVLGSWGYFIKTLKGEVKPNKVTWFLWFVAPTLAFTAQISQGVGLVSLTTFVAGFIPLIIFLASFFNKSANWKLEKRDLLCGILSIVGLVLWLLTRIGNLAIFLSISASFLASFPTLVKAYKFPNTESSTIYIIGAVTSVIALLTLTKWNFQYYAFPLYLLLINVLISIILLSNSKKRHYE
jgi:hypothetical protein